MYQDGVSRIYHHQPNTHEQQTMTVFDLLIPTMDYPAPTVLNNLAKYGGKKKHMLVPLLLQVTQHETWHMSVWSR